ncbi:uroporphyrinogen-III synthase [Paraurantiacibacter namhicola]|uniref:Uroporphyrinogen-III synthase n=1 Tax=Paraurantiacibacter namhicola TaxID=645517 RepID=A0A1C7D7E5_9SPHN|nr:uroporphyrinogen-III synthase [Paraurantiacibacter namhicola]ANU07368.1 uroporphyrinogen-III synthase [Paraurantiacibacter namhicola]
MTGSILCIRPEPGCAASVAAGRELRLEITALPLFAVEPVAWDVPEPAAFDAVLAGSANAFRHGGEGLGVLTGLPVLAVGKATAQAAEDAGFAVEATGQGGLQGVLDSQAAEARRLLRLAGEDRVPLDLPDGVSMKEAVVYRSRALSLPDDAAGRMGENPVVMLHSARAASHFADQLERIGGRRGDVRIAALGQRIAQAAGPGWAEVAIASTPSDQALLALVAQMCHSSGLNAPLS